MHRQKLRELPSRLKPICFDTTNSRAVAGAAVIEMLEVGRWRSPSMPGHYARGQLASRWRRRTVSLRRIGLESALRAPYSAIGTFQDKWGGHKKRSL